MSIMFILFRFLNPFFEGDGGGGGGTPAATPAVSSGEPAAATPAAPAAPASPASPTFNALRAGTIEPPAAPNPESTPAAIEEIDFGGRKVKVVDPVIHDLNKDFKELTGTLTKETQRAKQLEDDLAALRQTIANQPPAAPAPAPAPVEPVAPSAERMKEINDKYLEMAYEDPFGAQVWLNQQPEYQQLISPIQKQQVENVLTETQKAEQARKDDYQRMRQTMETKYTDFKDMVPHMQKAIELFPSLGEKLANNPSLETLEEAYRAAKLISVQAPASIPAAPAAPAAEPPTAPAQPTTPEQPKTLEQMLADPETIKQIIANPQITSTIISNYVNGVNNGQQQTPVMIGNQPGGSPPAMPPVEFKDIKDAGKGFRSWLKRNPPI